MMLDMEYINAYVTWKQKFEELMEIRKLISIAETRHEVEQLRKDECVVREAMKPYEKIINEHFGLKED